MDRLYCDECAGLAASSIQTSPKVIGSPMQYTRDVMVFHASEFNTSPRTEAVAETAMRILAAQGATEARVDWIDDEGGPYCSAFVEYTDSDGEKRQRLMPLLSAAA